MLRWNAQHSQWFNEDGTLVLDLNIWRRFQQETFDKVTFIKFQFMKPTGEDFESIWCWDEILLGVAVLKQLREIFSLKY